MKKSILTAIIAATIAVPSTTLAQTKGLTDTSKSAHAVMANTPLGAVKWTDGFWGERFKVYSDSSLVSMWRTWNDPNISHGFRNFEIAAGDEKGEHFGPPFHDGDMYKWLEAVAAVYAVNKDPKLDALMDNFIDKVVRAQQPNGYIHTPNIIAEINKRDSLAAHQDHNSVVTGTATGSKDDAAFANSLNFEAYNLGHLITAGIVHKRATGKETLYNAALKAADFLDEFYKRTADEPARTAVCPSHYMAMVELYRETGEPRYLELAEKFIDVRDKVENGTDDNQDRIPFRDQYNAMGHAVRANYLYAGVADLYAETGEEQLMKNLTSIWNDIVSRKMYITGACGALYDGTSPDGTCYTPDSIQKVHQSYGRPFQLPQSTAHNETCANIGNMLFNWRMLAATGDAKYADIVETALYNSVLSGVSLDGKRYFYTNPLRLSDDLPYTLRWPKVRQEYIDLCFCCPPNTLRTICEAQNYAYTVSPDALWCNLYGDNELITEFGKKKPLEVTQKTGYPYDGNVVITLNKVPTKDDFTVKLRVPEWCHKATLAINGVAQDVKVTPDTYIDVTRKWKNGDVITFNMDMPVTLLESNPLVEESRNHVAVKRGPIVYCLESIDIEGGKPIDSVLIPADAKFTEKEITIDGSKMIALETEAKIVDDGNWTGKLYREVSPASQTAKIQLIPYYAWGNRDKAEMTLWIPLAR